MSAVGVLLITGLRFLPPAFKNADVIGDLFFNLSIGYLGAWLFNLLVIEIPRRRQRLDAFQSVAYRLESLASIAAQIRFSLSGATKSGINLGDELDEIHRALMLACVETDSAKEPNAQSPKEVIEELYDRCVREFDQVDALVLMFFDVKLHAAAEKVIDAPFFRLASRADWRNPDQMEALATSLGMLEATGREVRAQLASARESI